MVHFSYVKKFRAPRNMHTSTFDLTITRRIAMATMRVFLLLAIGWGLGSGELAGTLRCAAAAEPPATGDAGTGSTNADPPAESAKARPTTVQLVVDFGDGFQKRYTRLAWMPGMTAWDVLQAAARHPRPLRVQHQGQKDTLLVLQIDGVAGGGPDEHHWIYRVNKNLAERSAGVVEVQAGDTVLWRLESYP